MKKHIKIAFYIYSLKRAGGAERRICELANQLSNVFQTVIICTWDPLDEECFFELSEKVEWVKLGFEQNLNDTKYHRTFRLLQSMRKYGIKLMIGFVMSADKSVFTAAKLSGIKLIVAERNAPEMYYIRFSKKQRYLSWMLLHFANKITVQFPEFVSGLFLIFLR